MDFKKDIILENERVILRPLVEEDFEHLSDFSINEPTLWKYSGDPANGLDRLKKYMNSAFEARKREDSYPFIVYDKWMKAYAGSTRFYDYQDFHRTVQLGYTWYGKKYWGTGLNKNCKFLMLQYAFDQLGLKRVEFRADANNTRSIAAMKSLGCVMEGTLRTNVLAETGIRRDSVVLSIIDFEWDGIHRANLLKRIQQLNDRD